MGYSRGREETHRRFSFRDVFAARRKKYMYFYMCFFIFSILAQVPRCLLAGLSPESGSWGSWGVFVLSPLARHHQTGRGLAAASAARRVLAKGSVLAPAVGSSPRWLRRAPKQAVVRGPEWFAGSGFPGSSPALALLVGCVLPPRQVTHFAAI